MVMELGARLVAWAGDNDDRRALARLIEALAEGARQLAPIVGRAAGDETLAAVVHANGGGDAQKKLDAQADAIFMAALRGVGVASIASEEQDEAVAVDPEGRFAVAIDPLDGSSNIETNIPIGTIFGIWPQSDRWPAGRLQLASGFFLYGPQTLLVLTLREGVDVYLLDPATGRFGLVRTQATVRPGAAEYAINGSNRRHWPHWVRAFVEDCEKGRDGPMEADFNTRWIASAVAEVYRLLVRGGVYLYPGDARPGYEEGRLRLLYEAAPLALILEQAEGAASDGESQILDLEPVHLHQRIPLVLGSRDHVERVQAYRLADAERRRMPLFASRGLYHR